MSSHVAAVRAQELGYKDIRIMREGTKGWAALGYPLVRGSNVAAMQETEVKHA